VTGYGAEAFDEPPVKRAKSMEGSHFKEVSRDWPISDGLNLGRIHAYA
jgi:hypothetical protein